MGCENKEKCHWKGKKAISRQLSHTNFVLKYIFSGRRKEKQMGRQVHSPRIKSKNKKGRRQEKLTRNDRVNLGSSRPFSSWILKLFLFCERGGKGHTRSN